MMIELVMGLFRTDLKPLESIMCFYGTNYVLVKVIFCFIHDDEISSMAVLVGMTIIHYDKIT